jgi:hypothetical protein
MFTSRVHVSSVTASVNNSAVLLHQSTCQQYYCISQLASYTVFLKSQVEVKLDIAKKNKIFKAEAVN